MQDDLHPPGRPRRWAAVAAGALRPLRHLGGRGRPAAELPATDLELGRGRLIAWLAEDLHVRVAAVRAALDTLGDPRGDGAVAARRRQALGAELDELAVLLADLAALADPGEAADPPRPAAGGMGGGPLPRATPVTGPGPTGLFDLAYETGA